MKPSPTKDTMQVEQAAHSNHARSRSMSAHHALKREAMEESTDPPIGLRPEQAEEMHEKSKGGKRKGY